MLDYIGSRKVGDFEDESEFEVFFLFGFVEFKGKWKGIFEVIGGGKGDIMVCFLNFYFWCVVYMWNR